MTQDMEHPSSPPQGSSLLKLPTELVREILSYVLAKPAYFLDVDVSYGYDYDSDDYSDDDFDLNDLDDVRSNNDDRKSRRHDYRRLRNSPVLTIRSVCRHFRSIAAELPFWWDDNLDLLKLKTIGKSDVEDAAFLNALFKDPQIVLSLARRKHWHIHDVPCLVEIMQAIPTFFENTVSITVNQLERQVPEQYNPQWLDIIVGHLASCQKIRTIELGPCRVALKQSMGQLWPALETLIIWLPFWGVGVVDGLTQLRRMEIKTRNRTTLRTSLLLPFESTATLTHLDIGCWPPGRNYVAISLDAFVNLTTLSIKPLTIDICQFLISFQGHLQTFSTQSFRGSLLSLEDIAVTFRHAQCLQTVQNFIFKFNMETDDGSVYLLQGENDLERFNPIIEAITNIPSIQILHLFMPVDGRWYRHFHHLTNLKHLKWAANEEELLNLSPQSLGLPIEVPNYSLREENLATKIFSEAFAGFSRAPEIDFRFWAHCRDERWYEEPQEEGPIDLGKNREWGPSYEYNYSDLEYSDGYYTERDDYSDYEDEVEGGQDEGGNDDEDGNDEDDVDDNSEAEDEEQ